MGGLYCTLYREPIHLQGSDLQPATRVTYLKSFHNKVPFLLFNQYLICGYNSFSIDITMWALVSLLIFTAIVLPTVSLNYDEPLTSNQWEVLELLLQIAGVKAAIVFLVSFVTGNYS